MSDQCGPLWYDAEPTWKGAGRMIGRTYLERGAPVVVLVQWKGLGPRNVLVLRASGEKVVRPFRGLRKAV